MPNVGVATALVMLMQRGDDARDDHEVRERDSEHGEQQRGQHERVDHAARPRMDRGNDEEPELREQHREPETMPPTTERRSSVKITSAGPNACSSMPWKYSSMSEADEELRGPEEQPRQSRRPWQWISEDGYGAPAGAP